MVSRYARAVTLQGAMLFVKDLDRMTAFYSEVLGLTVVTATRLANTAARN
jgi:catechol-2,3-dioxygenase